MARIICPLKEAVAISGRESAVIQGDAIAIFSQLDIFVSATAGKLIAHGVQPGQAIALRLEHRIRSIVVILACIRIKAVACPISPRIPNAQLKDYFSALGAAMWVDDFPCAGPQVPAGVQRLESDDVVGQLVDDMELELPDKITLNRLATMVFTSGSSGQPKATAHTYANHYYSALGANSALKLKSHCKWLLNLPLYHVSGLAVVFRCLKAGAAMVLPGGEESTAQTIAREGITHLSAVPTQLHRYLKDPEMVKALQSLQVLLVGGAPLSGKLLSEALALKIPVYTCYGLTESSSLVTLAAPGLTGKHRVSSGKALRYREFRLDGRGEIWVRGSTRFAGYQERGKLTSPFDKDGWYATGDVGELDEKGNLCFLGRHDWMFTSGGENIHPEEIEAALMQLPCFSRAVVVPVPDEEFGHRPVAVVDRVADTMSDDQVQRSLEEFMPRFKIPDRYLDWSAELDGEPGMKLDRQHVIDWVLKGL